MTQEESREKQLRQIGQAERMRTACERLSTEALREHNRRLHERRERIVMEGIREGSWREHYSLRGTLLDVTGLMVFAISGEMQRRFDLARWVVARGLQREAA